MKKILSLILMLFPLVSSAQDAIDTRSLMFGDYNNDGKITVSDITYLANIIMGKASNKIISGDFQLNGNSAMSSMILFGDYNFDGKIDTLDIKLMLNISLTQRSEILVTSDSTINFKEKTALEYGIVNINYLWEDKKGDDYMSFNVNYPLDGSNTYKYSISAEPLYFAGDNAYLEEVQGMVHNLNSLWIYKAISFSDKDAYRKNQMPVYYFHPQNKNVLVINEIDSTYYTLDVDNDYIGCCRLIVEEDPRKTGNYITRINNVSKEPLDFVKKAETTSLIKTSYGIYLNTKLYALKPGEVRSDKNCIAELNRYTGQIHYRYNERSKAVLNMAEQLSAYVGIFLPDQSEEIAIPIHSNTIANNIINIRFNRPINVEMTEQGYFNDAFMYSYISVFDKFSFTDWRGKKFVDANKSDKYSDAWLYAFYGLKSISIDFSEATYYAAGEKIPATSIGSIWNLTYVDSNKKDIIACNYDAAKLVGTKTIDLSGFNNQSMGIQATYDNLVDYFGYIKFQNLGSGAIKNTTVTIPVTITYDWGEIKTQIIASIDNYFQE